MRRWGGGSGAGAAFGVGQALKATVRSLALRWWFVRVTCVIYAVPGGSHHLWCTAPYFENNCLIRLAGRGCPCMKRGGVIIRGPEAVWL